MGGTEPSSTSSVWRADSVVVPAPRSLGRSYAGLRRMRWRTPATLNSSITSLESPGAHRWLRIRPTSEAFPDTVP